MIDNIKLSYFNNISDVVPKQKMYSEYLEMIKSEDIFFNTQRIRSLDKITREDKAHTPNVSINYTFNGRRDTNGIDVSTPLLELEFDVKNNKHINLQSLKQDIKANPHPSLVLCADTLSGKGLLLHFIIDDLNIEFKKNIWLTLTKWFNDTYKTTINFDSTSLTSTHVRYLAFDNDPYINKEAKPFVYTKFFEEKTVTFVPEKKVRHSEKLLKDYVEKLKTMGYELTDGKRNSWVVKLTYFALNNVIKLSVYEKFLETAYPEYPKSEHKKTVRYIYKNKKPIAGKATIKEFSIQQRVTEVSEQITSEIVRNKKVLIQSDTGSGKSHYIFNDLLPHFKSNIHWEEDVIILCATPLKFLTIQQKNYLKKSNLKYEIVCEGHTSAKSITREVLYDKHLIQTTFESLKEIYKKCVEHNIKVILLIDEVHQLITSSHYMRLGELREAIEYSSFFVGFSGTIKEIYENYYDFNIPLINISQTNPKNEIVEHIELPTKNAVVEEICGRLTNIFGRKNILNDKKYLIFLNNTDKIEQCYEFCLHKGIKVDRVHRNLSKIDDRSVKTLKHISEKEAIPDEIDVLFTTSLLDTGVNITNENLEIWYFSHLNDNDIIKFEQSVNRYRNNNKTIKLFTIAQKRVQMYYNLLNAGRNALRDNRLVRYYSRDINYITACIGRGELTFPNLKPTTFSYNKTQIRAILAGYQAEVAKLNEIIKLKKDLNIDGIDIEFIKTKEKSDLNGIIDYSYVDDKGFYNLDIFRVVNKLRMDEVSTITNENFIKKIKKDGRRIVEKNRANINNQAEIEEQVEKYEEKKELIEETVFKILRRGVKDPYVQLKCFFENLSSFANDEYVKKESYNIFSNIEQIFDIETIELTEEQRKEHFDSYKNIYTNTKVYTYIIKNFLKLYNSFRYLGRNIDDIISWEDWVNLLEQNLDPKDMISVQKSIYYHLNLEVYNNYYNKNKKTNSIVELQTIYIKNLINMFDKELGTTLCMDDIMKKMKQLPKVKGVEMENISKEKVANILRMFYNITATRRSNLGRMERIYRFESKKDFEFYFSTNKKNELIKVIDGYVKEKINDKKEINLQPF